MKLSSAVAFSSVQLGISIRTATMGASSFTLSGWRMTESSFTSVCAKAGAASSVSGRSSAAAGRTEKEAFLAMVTAHSKKTGLAKAKRKTAHLIHGLITPELGREHA